MDYADRVPALSDEILMSIEKPARYIGGELNSVMKDKDKVDIRFVMCFPDVYEIGMSHLGIQILYGLFNSYEDVWCERVYSPWTDLDPILRKEKIPLFALESQEPIKGFDFMGITLQYEMCYTNVLQLLDLSGIPLLAKDRTNEDPIVIGGGPCVYNPEPITDFFDIFYIGEGETEYRNLFDLYKKCQAEGVGRKEFLRQAASIEGMYIPSLYEVTYLEDGRIKDMKPIADGVPRRVKKTVVKDLDTVFYPLKPVVPFIRATQDRVVLEVQRGCIRNCRFCQAGQIYKPIRERSADTLKRYAQELIANTGYEEISLSSLSTSDYTELEELLEYLIDECNRRKINISLPSLRIDAFSLDVMNKVQDVKKNSLTFAPEAGSQRMRDVINKGITKEDILSGAAMAFEGGWNSVKLYFMLGLPGEEEDDIREIATLCNEIAALYYETVPKEKRMGRVRITASSSFFVPKPFTAFQWARMNTMDEFIGKAEITKRAVAAQLNQKSIEYKWHEAGTTILEGIFARGDRKVGEVIRKAYESGCIFDAWSETYRHDLWMKAFEDCGLDYTFYIFREREDDEVFPWDFINCGVMKSYLLREWKRSREGLVTKNCRDDCAKCGCLTYQCGICIR